MVSESRTWWNDLYEWIVGATIGWSDLVVSGIILAVSIVVALVFSTLVFRRLLRLSIVAGANFDVKTVAAIRIPIAAFVLLAGLYLALIALSPPPQVQILLNKASSVIAILIGAVLVNGLASGFLFWLEIRAQNSRPDGSSGWLFPLVRRGVLAFVVAVAVMVSLDILGLNISPLIAGLGIAGLAIALALQPTLGNLFAGTYVISEGVINVGDYIEMANGIDGFVVDVNWRSTRLRTRTNNLVVVPNSVFAETIITNFNKPEDPVNMIIPCGVAYESDLVEVERIGLEETNAVREEHPGAVREFEPRFIYRAFGDSNIDFVVVIRAQNRIAGFNVRSELIKRLHSRFAAEGITINYPARTLHFPNGILPRQNEQLLPDATTAALAAYTLGAEVPPSGA
ncbi:MAG: mechanosensitive ion channel family protein [Chloroflexi bacterium]|nr:mechanosensitive ion channel family protein [Chloroflexota bacterium]